MTWSIYQFLQIFILLCLVMENLGYIENFEVDLNDILDVNLMPTALFLHGDIEVDVNDSVPGVQTRGDFSKAYKMMGFHRKMMNEYLCNNFIAKQIVLEFSPSINSTFSPRAGVPAEEENTKYTNSSTTREAKMIPNEELYDSGSTGYKKWLEKTTTLDDIQSQLASNNINIATNATQSTKQRKRMESNRRNTYDVEELAEDEYEEGDITGYAIQRPFPVQQVVELKDYTPDLLPGKSNFQEQPLPLPYPTAGNKNGYYPSDHEGYEENYGVNYPVDEEKQSKELGLKDVMEIAMTTLAYLSFGMFLLQVLMCITMDKSNNMMMMPMEAADGNGEVEEIRRRKRSAEGSQNLHKINEISRRVLISIDAVRYVGQDDGQCLYRVLCENNKFAKEQNDRQKIWIPVWGLGLTWLSLRMARPDSLINTRLASIKASVLGLGGANCGKFYSECDFYKMAEYKRVEYDKVKVDDYEFRWSD